MHRFCRQINEAQLFGALLGRVPDAALRQQYLGFMKAVKKIWCPARRGEVWEALQSLVAKKGTLILVMHISQFSDFLVDKVDKVILSGPSTLIPWSVSWLGPQMIDAQAMQPQSFSRPSPKARFGWGIGGVLVSKSEHQHRCGMMWESFCFDSNKSKLVPDNFVRLQFFDPTRPHFCMAIGLGLKIELLPISISQW